MSVSNKDAGPGVLPYVRLFRHRRLLGSSARYW